MAIITPLYRSGDGLWVDIQDNATPYVRYLAATFPKEMRKAMKSLGWFLRGKIVTGLQTGSPAGRMLPKLSLIQRVRLLDAIKTVKRRKRPLKYAKGRGKGRPSRFYYMTQAKIIGGATDKPYGRKMVRAVRYKYDDNAKSVSIGWITPTAASYGRALGGGKRGARHQWKSSQTVTARMSKLFAAAGIYVKPGKVLKTPPRPVVDPIFQQQKAAIPRYLEDKVSAYLRQSLGRSVQHHAARAVMGNAAYNRFARYAA